MMHPQANALILIVLASASFLSLVPECRADGDQKLIEEAKQKWLIYGYQRLGEHMLGKVTPEETAEILKEVHATMPNDDMSKEWNAKRTEVARLIDLATINEECPGRETFKAYSLRDRKYSPAWGLPERWVLLRGYAKYFEDKQVEICVAKINEQLAEGVARVREEDERDLEALMSYLPQLQTSDNWEWDESPYRAVLDKEQVYKAVYRFVEETAGPLSKRIIRPDRKTKLNTLLDERLEFCSRIEAQTQYAVKYYLGIRHYARLKEFTSRFKPKTLKWIKASKLCTQIREDSEMVRWRMYQQFREWIKYDEPKTGQPSVARSIINCLKPKKQTSE